jgi:hypothetical protein
VAVGFLWPGDSYEVAMKLSAEVGCLVGEMDILKLKYEGMMVHLRLAER